MLRRIAVVLVVLLAALLAPRLSFAAPDDARVKKAQEAIAKGIEALRKSQAEDGSWSAKPGPAITAMAARVMLQDPRVKRDDPQLRKAIAYVLSKSHADGSVHDGKIENYNTAIALSMMASLNDEPGMKDRIKKAEDFLRDKQWSNQTDPQGKVVDESHPFYGGAGYGGTHGRPDMSNTNMLLDAFYDAGVDCNDPVFQRAVVFVGKCQASDTNKAPYREKLSNDGGMIYATSINKDKIGVPETKAGEDIFDGPNGEKVSKLRSYGSVSYAGLKTYVYAQLDKKDPRVVDVWRYITRNYSVDVNPGFVDDPKTPGDERQSSYYYYMLTMSRALKAWGEDEITLADGTKRKWANDVIDKIVSLQKPDGTWTNTVDLWYEGDPNLVTCYAIIALQHAMK